MTQFCLIRHGQTDWNLEGRYQGQSDVSLNATGLAQARALAQRLAGEHFDALYSSDLARARETAQAIAELQKLPVHFDVRLREINQGEWEGVLVETIRAHYTELWQQRKEDPARLRAPGGETVGEVMARVTAATTEIATQYPNGRVLLVSHGLALATLLCQVRGVPVGLAYEQIPANAEPVWITWPPALPS